MENAKQIMFNVEMSKAILEGRKTQTRRAIKYGLYAIENDMNEHSIEVASSYCDLDEHNHPELKSEMIKHAKYKVGDIIGIRESVQITRFDDILQQYDYRYVADGQNVYQADIPKRYKRPNNPKWMINLHKVPNGCLKEMVRIYIKVTDVRVERLQDITGDGIEKEGLPKEIKHFTEAKAWWEKLWNKFAPLEYKIVKNPYVFVYEFEKVSKHTAFAKLLQLPRATEVKKCFKRFRDAEPESSGNYYVIWEDGDEPIEVYLRDCREMFKDDKEMECKWTWGVDIHDDPEALEMDIKDWKNIQWCTVAEFEKVER